MAFLDMFVALSCFQHIFTLDPCSSMLVHMLFISIYVLYALCHVFVPRSIFSMCCLARSACFYACSHVFLSRSTCFMLYAMFSHALFLFLFYVDVRVICSHACMMLLAMPCLDLCVYAYASMLQGQILVFTCLYA